MSRRFKVVVVGLGIQGKKRLKFAGADVVATVDPVVAAADHKKIEDVPLSNYDAALVSTPDDAKASLIRTLLTSGKHVLVEKPFSASGPEEIRSLRDLARSKKLACYTAYNHRFEPHLVKAKEVLEQNTLGKLYLAKFFYGNGTARDVRESTWRDRGNGVIGDLGSHLLDMALFLFGKTELEPQPWRFERFENRSYDYAFFASTGKPLIEFEMTLLSWRNTFRMDLFGEKGSLHVDCLCKWGPSTLVVRKRVLPSGRPAEESETLSCPDPTWEKEYEHFKKLCLTGGDNLDNDLWIHERLTALAEPTLKGRLP